MIEVSKKPGKPLYISGYNSDGKQILKSLSIDCIIQMRSYAHVFHENGTIEFLPGNITGINLIDGMITIYYDHGGYIEINR